MVLSRKVSDSDTGPSSDIIQILIRCAFSAACAVTRQHCSNEADKVSMELIRKDSWQSVSCGA
eukprot:6176663-Pleurochrysis_carterae.AAC.1